MSEGPWLREIRVHRDERRLEIDFEGGPTASLPAELLRVESPSADVQGHSAAEKRTIPGKRRVGIVAVEPVGNYAVRIRFDDGHATGIYSWRYLHRLATEQDRIWRDYLAALEAKSLSRDP